MIFGADYGVTGDGGDQTLQMQALIAASASTGDRDIVLPSGVICVGDTIKIDAMGTTLRGANRLGTIIKTMHASKNILELNGWYSEARDIGFDAGVPRTGGTSVHLLGAHTKLRDFMINNDFVGVHMTGAVASIKSGLLGTGLAHSTRILVDGGDTSQLIDDVVCGAQNGPFPDFGVRVVDSAALVIRGTRIMNAGVGLALLPGAGQGVHSLYASDSFFDSGSTGIMVAPTNGGNVSRCRWSGCWTGGGTANGVDIHKDAAGSGSISGMHFDAHHSINNVLSGFSVGTGVEDFAINGGEIAGNDFGVWIAEAVPGFRVQNATIGYGAGMVSNRKWGVFVSNYCGHYQVTGNTMLYNGTGGCNKSTDAFGIVNNIG
jgi:hypothetical protein